MNRQQSFDAVMAGSVEHLDGSQIRDTQHILNWLIADGQQYEFIRGGIGFDACSRHADPDECSCAELDAMYLFRPTWASPEAVGRRP